MRVNRQREGTVAANGSQADPDIEKPSSKFRKTICLVAAVVVPMAVAAYWVHLRSVPIDRVAAERLQDLWQGNTRALFSMEFPQEQQYEHMTQAKVDEIWSELFLPRIRGWHWVAAPTTDVYGAGGEGVAEVRISDDHGHLYHFGVNVWATDDGPKMQLVLLLQLAYRVKYMAAKGLPPTALNQLNAVLTGLQLDKNRLDALGIPYDVSVDPIHGTFDKTPWEDGIRNIREKIRENEKLARQDAPPYEKNPVAP